MKVEYNNLYTHFVFTTLNREPLINPENRVRIEKYVTGIIINCAGIFSSGRTHVHHRRRTSQEEYKIFRRFYQRTLRPK